MLRNSFQKTLIAIQRTLGLILLNLRCIYRINGTQSQTSIDTHIRCQHRAQRRKYRWTKMSSKKFSKIIWSQSKRTLVLILGPFSQITTLIQHQVYAKLTMKHQETHQWVNLGPQSGIQVKKLFFALILKTKAIADRCKRTFGLIL